MGWSVDLSAIWLPGVSETLENSSSFHRKLEVGAGTLNAMAGQRLHRYPLAGSMRATVPSVHQEPCMRIRYQRSSRCTWSRGRKVLKHLSPGRSAAVVPDLYVHRTIPFFLGDEKIAHHTAHTHLEDACQKVRPLPSILRTPNPICDATLPLPRCLTHLALGFWPFIIHVSSIQRN